MQEDTKLRISYGTSAEAIAELAEKFPIVEITVVYPLTPTGKKTLAWCKKNLPEYRLIAAGTGAMIEEHHAFVEFIQENSPAAENLEEELSEADLRALIRDYM